MRGIMMSSTYFILSQTQTEEEISQAVELAINTHEENFIEANDYADPVSMKVVKIIQSYTNVVNRTIWLKQI